MYSGLVPSALWGADYGEVIARGVDWVLRCRLQEGSFDPPPYECGLVTQHLVELALRGVEVEGERADVTRVLRTLRRVRRELFKGSGGLQRHFETKAALSRLIARLEEKSGSSR